MTFNRAEYNQKRREWRAANREQHLKERREYYAAVDFKKSRIRTQLWKRRNPEKNREQVRRYRMRHPDRHNEANKKWWAQLNPERQWAKWLKDRYKITQAEYDAFLTAQGFKCAVCKTDFNEIPKKKRHVDHCHKTGKVRGVLCFSCNWALGFLKDDEATISNLLEYVRR
jgi:hypothetical protein